jgi:hypothetical protein
MIIVDFMPKVFIVQTLNVCVNEETGYREDIMRTAAAFTDPSEAFGYIAGLIDWECESTIVSANGGRMSRIEAQSMPLADFEKWADGTPPLHRVQIPSEV